MDKQFLYFLEALCQIDKKYFKYDNYSNKEPSFMTLIKWGQLYIEWNRDALPKLKELQVELLAPVLEFIAGPIRKTYRFWWFTYRSLWFRATFRFKPGRLYFNPPTKEIIKIVSFHYDDYSNSELLVNFEVVRPAPHMRPRTYTIYDWDDFLSNFHSMRPITETEKLIYAV